MICKIRALTVASLKRIGLDLFIVMTYLRLYVPWSTAPAPMATRVAPSALSAAMGTLWLSRVEGIFRVRTR